MMKIRLMELELENKLIDEKEKSEERETELALAKKDNQKYKIEVSAQKKTIEYLRNKMAELEQQIKELEGGGEEAAAGADSNSPD